MCRHREDAAAKEEKEAAFEVDEVIECPMRPAWNSILAVAIALPQVLLEGPTSRGEAVAAVRSLSHSLKTDCRRFRAPVIATRTCIVHPEPGRFFPSS